MQAEAIPLEIAIVPLHCRKSQALDLPALPARDQLPPRRVAGGVHGTTGGRRPTRASYHIPRAINSVKGLTSFRKICVAMGRLCPNLTWLLSERVMCAESLAGTS